MPVTPVQATASGRGRQPRLPAFVLAGIVFAILLLAGNLVVMRLAAPILLARADLTHLKPTLLQIVFLAYGSTFIAALVAGIAAGQRGLRRGSVSRAGNIFSAAFGTLLVAGAVITVALFARLPLPGRPTEINLGLIALGAIAGAWLMDLRGREAGARKPGPGPRHPSPGTVIAGASMLANLLGSPAGAMVGQGAKMPAGPIAVQSAAGSLDVEPAECVLLSRAVQVDADLTLASISLGPHFAYEEVQHPNGAWETIATSGLQGGLKLVLGQHVAANLLKGTSFREGLSFELDADGLLTQIDSYALDSATAANNEVIEDALTYLDNDLILPVAAQLIQPTLASATPAKALRIPKDTALELAGNLSLKVQGGVGVGAEVSLEVGSKSGLNLVGDETTQPLSNPQEIDLYVGLNGEAEGVVSALLNQANGKGAADLVLTMAIVPNPDLAKVWAPSKISFEAAGELAASGGLAYANDSGAADAGASRLPWLKQLAGTTSAGRRLEVASGLNFSPNDGHPADLVTVVEFFSALGPVLAGSPTAAQQAALQSASQNFALAIAKDATVQASVFNTASANASIELAWGALITFGASAEAELSNESLIGATYLDQTRQWTDSQTCRSPGTA